MKHLLKFNWLYFVLTVLIFGTEILIAKYAHDQIIRPYVGDLLVVILIYCFIKSFLDSAVFVTALSVLTFSYVVETLQYFHIVTKLGLQNSEIAKTIMGTSFEWIDLVAYTIGIALVIYLEKTTTKALSTLILANCILCSCSIFQDKHCNLKNIYAHIILLKQ